MNSLLARLLKKRGINSLEEMTEDEKRDFENWREILSKDSLNIDDIKEFCQYQCDIIKQKWSDYNIEQSRKSELIPYFTVYNTILQAIDSPKAQREAIEKQLIQLTK